MPEKYLAMFLYRNLLTIKDTECLWLENRDHSENAVIQLSNLFLNMDFFMDDKHFTTGGYISMISFVVKLSDKV